MGELVVAGLDMSYTATGFCLRRGAEIRVETIKTTTKTCSNELERIQYICKEIMSRIPRDVDMVCIEDFYTPASRAQMGSAIRLVMLGAAMRLALYHAGYPFYIPAASQIKKFATSKGNCDKSIVVREVFKRWGVEAANDNEADAAAMAYMALAIAQFRGEETMDEWPKFQVDVVKKVAKERPNFNVGE
jgi:crossover junction endodeoxyribonuclease RuvC